MEASAHVSVSRTLGNTSPYRFHRGMTRPFFSKDRISHFEIFDRHAADAIRQVKERMREGYAVDIQVSIQDPPLPIFLTFFQDVVSRFTLDSATEFLFGMFVLVFGASRCSEYSQPSFPGTFVHSRQG